MVSYALRWRFPQRSSTAPTAGSDVFLSNAWVDGIDKADDLAKAVAALEEARADVVTCFTPAAWGIDLASARATLASHGAGYAFTHN